MKFWRTKEQKEIDRLAEASPDGPYHHVCYRKDAAAAMCSVQDETNEELVQRIGLEYRDLIFSPTTTEADVREWLRDED